MDTGKFFLYTLLIVSGGAVPLIVLIGLFLHITMSKIFDLQLLNNKYFNEFELKTLNSFPLSILKTLAYIRGTVAPNTIKKRFKGFDFRNQLSSTIYLVNIFWVVLLFLSFVSLLGAISGLVVKLYLK